MLYQICRVHEAGKWLLSFVLEMAVDPSFAVGVLERYQLENCPAFQSNGDRRIAGPLGCMIASFLRPKGCRDFAHKPYKFTDVLCILKVDLYAYFSRFESSFVERFMGLPLLPTPKEDIFLPLTPI